MSAIAILLSLTFSALPVDRAEADLLPFGVTQRQNPSSLDCKPIADAPMDMTGQYLCASLPSGKPMFEDYILAYVQGLGICNVVGISPYGLDDARGTAAQRLFARAKADMSADLGPPDEEVDHAHTPSASRADLFRSTVISEERQIFAQWNGLGSRFPNLQSATLAISGDEELGLAVYEVYRFAGNDECLRHMEVVTGLSAD